MDGRDAAMIGALRRIYDAFNRGDFEAVVQMVHPDAELVRGGGQSPVRGVAALRAWMEPDAFEEQRIEPLDFTVNGDKVFVRQRTTARGAGSGIELDVNTYAVWTLDGDDLVTRVEGYLAHEEAGALEAAGLSE